MIDPANDHSANNIKEENTMETNITKMPVEQMYLMLTTENKRLVDQKIQELIAVQSK